MNWTDVDETSYKWKDKRVIYPQLYANVYVIFFRNIQKTSAGINKDSTFDPQTVSFRLTKAN